jgi:hypothetical protein
MNADLHRYLKKEQGAALIALLLAATLSAVGCGSGEGPLITDIPRYPGADLQESMAQSIPGGFMGGRLEQYSTEDAYIDVVAFYASEMSGYNPEISTFESEMGPQTSITVQRGSNALTVAIQEFPEEGVVNITFMQVGM